MTTVLDTEMYEWQVDPPETALCEDCGTEMNVPDLTDADAGFMQPHFRRCSNVWEALCDSCYSESVSEILTEKEHKEE